MSTVKRCACESDAASVERVSDAFGLRSPSASPTRKPTPSIELAAAEPCAAEHRRHARAQAKVLEQHDVDAGVQLDEPLQATYRAAKAEEPCGELDDLATRVCGASTGPRRARPALVQHEPEKAGEPGQHFVGRGARREQHVAIDAARFRLAEEALEHGEIAAQKGRILLLTREEPRQAAKIVVRGMLGANAPHARASRGCCRAARA